MLYCTSTSKSTSDSNSPDNRKKKNNSSQQAKDLQLGLILILVVCMFFMANLPRVLLNLYELFYVNEIIDCKEAFIPPTWFICSTSVNHLLLVLNCIMNFVIYCCCNESFRNILFFKPLAVSVSHMKKSNFRKLDYSSNPLFQSLGYK